MRAYREPPGREPVVDGGTEGVGVVEGVPRGGVDDGTVEGGVIEGFEGVGMVAVPDAGDVPWYRTPQSRILLCPTRAGVTPPRLCGGETRPCWTLRQAVAALYRDGGLWPWLQRLRSTPLDRTAVLDARLLRITMATERDQHWYSYLRGVQSRLLPRGFRVPTMVTWGRPNARPEPGLWRSAWCARWTARVMGPVWLTPDLQAHTRWTLSLPHWIDTYQSWFDPICSFDSGLVLDTRMLALQAQTIPLRPAMVDRLSPHVRCLSLADIPPQPEHPDFPAAQPWLTDTPHLPGSTRRYSRERWCALLDQFPHVPVLLPALTHPREVPPWLRARLQAEPHTDTYPRVPPRSAVSQAMAYSQPWLTRPRPALSVPR